MDAVSPTEEELNPALIARAEEVGHDLARRTTRAIGHIEVDAIVSYAVPPGTLLPYFMLDIAQRDLAQASYENMLAEQGLFVQQGTLATTMQIRRKSS